MPRPTPPSWAAVSYPWAGTTSGARSARHPRDTGPYTANAGDIARLLILKGGAVEVADAQSLAKAVGRLLLEPAARERASDRRWSSSRRIAVRSSGSLRSSSIDSGAEPSRREESSSSRLRLVRVCSERIPAACCSFTTLTM